MALYSLRLRRTLTTLSSLHRSLHLSPSAAPTTNFASVISPSLSITSKSDVFGRELGVSRTIQTSLYSTKQYKVYKEGDEITPDTVLFEGCDYNHWLITMDFPKDNPPSAEEMVATYEQTCAKGLGISLEEAKQRMYACSTTTYQGFQALMTEEESEKFRDVPGVVFILPDSYIDPVNKEYGGDKYENGHITHRPPPVQYGRGGRSRPRYDNQGGSMQNQGGYPPRNPQRPIQGDGRNYGPPQTSYAPRQNYGPNQGNFNQGQGGQGGPMPNHQGNYNQGPPLHGGNLGRIGNPNYGQSYPGQGQGPPANPGYGQGQGPPANSGYGQGQGPPVNSGYGQGQGQSANPGYGQRQGQPANPGYGQSYAGQGQGQTFPQKDQSNPHGEPGNYSPREQTGTDQGRY